MDMNLWKKGLWVVLFFSLALNAGFAFMAVSWKFMPRYAPPPPGPMGLGPMGPGPMGPNPMGPGPEPILNILDRMDLADDIREKVKKNLKQMDEDHHEFVRQLFEKEKKVLTLIGRPGDLDMGTLTPLIESFSRIRKESVLNKVRHIVEIRKLLGREKSVYLISEIKKDFEKRVQRDKPTD